MKKMPIGKLIAIIVIFIGIIFGLYKFGVFEYISIKNIQKLKEWINGFKILAPIVYIGLYIVSALFFLPGLPITLLAGIAFGPLLGALYADIGATLGATGAFLIARYAARGMVEGWAQSNEQFRKIDEGVQKQGWRMLMITRLVPVFPYNIQNFAYGLTKINLVTFIVVSFLCMLPGAAAFTFMAGAIVEGKSPIQILIYLSIGAVLLVAISLIPGYLQKKKGMNVD